MIVNPEKALDSLVDDMTDEEYEEYETFWDQKGPWRTALNAAIRGSFLVLVMTYILDYKLGIVSAIVAGVIGLFAHSALAGWIYAFCTKLSIKVLIRLDRI